MAEKIYLNGGAKEIKTEYGSLFSVSVELVDAQEKELIRKVKDKNGVERSYLNFMIAERREPTEWGQTHYLYTKEQEGAPSKKASKKKESDDLPF